MSHMHDLLVSIRNRPQRTPRDFRTLQRSDGRRSFGNSSGRTHAPDFDNRFKSPAAPLAAIRSLTHAVLTRIKQNRRVRDVAVFGTKTNVRHGAEDVR
jgi:hypothetical protein